MASDHDTGYKPLFSHPEMVRDLLLEYVPGEWISDADETIEETLTRATEADLEAWSVRSCRPKAQEAVFKIPLH